MTICFVHVAVEVDGVFVWCWGWWFLALCADVESGVPAVGGLCVVVPDFSHGVSWGFFAAVVAVAVGEELFDPV